MAKIYELCSPYLSFFFFSFMGFSDGTFNMISKEDSPLNTGVSKK